jgi:uncharacterized protein (TIGR00299 family) protein
VVKQGIAATRFKVRLEKGDQPHRHLKHVVEVIRGGDLPDRVRDSAIHVFERLAAAEATIHNTTVEKVHFHEVGAVDAILDITGAVLALDLLGIEKVVCSPIPVGSGTVDCEHGTLPVPAPATARLLLGAPVAPTTETGELTTPTAAALLMSLASSFGPLPEMTLSNIGYGAGTRDGATRPNVLRVLVGEAQSAGGKDGDDTIVQLETNIDDATPELIGHCMERLMEAGALDVYAVPIQMKKWRPGVLLSVLCEPHQVAAMEHVIFAETTTFGIRRQTLLRSKLARRHETVSTSYGDVRMKVGEKNGVLIASPEFEDCRMVAASHGVPVREVIAAAAASWRRRQE